MTKTVMNWKVKNYQIFVKNVEGWKTEWMKDSTIFHIPNKKATSANSRSERAIFDLI